MQTVVLLSMVKEAGVVSPCWVKLCVHVYVCVYFLFCHQILFSFADAPLAIQEAVITMQLEVARRLVAQPNCKDYGILSVVFQLYTTYVAKVSWRICSQLMSVLHILHVCMLFSHRPRILFQIPPTVFYPQPKVQSALVRVTFKHPTSQATEEETFLRGHEVLGGSHPMLFRRARRTSY